MKNSYIICLLLFLTLPIQVYAVEGEKEVWINETEELFYEGESYSDNPAQMKEGIDIPENRKPPDPQYRRTNPKREQSFHPPRTRENTPQWVRILAYALIAGVAVFLIYLIIKALDPHFRLKRNKKGSITPSVFLTDPESLKEADYEKIIQSAIIGNDLRLAVRLRFLDTLKHLEEKNIIQWKRSKTNRQYLNEAQRMMPVDELKMLILIYEQVWFGSFQINIKLFEVFNQLVIKVIGGNEE